MKVLDVRSSHWNAREHNEGCQFSIQYLGRPQMKLFYYNNVFSIYQEISFFATTRREST